VNSCEYDKGLSGSTKKQEKTRIPFFLSNCDLLSEDSSDTVMPLGIMSGNGRI
jgi:hypothetical protein